MASHKSVYLAKQNKMSAKTQREYEVKTNYVCIFFYSQNTWHNKALSAFSILANYEEDLGQKLSKTYN